MKTTSGLSMNGPENERAGSQVSGAPPELSARERALATLLLVGVGVCFLILQLTLVSMHRRPTWDEAIYLSQVAPRARALWFLPWRARGITLLIAPVLDLGGSVAAVRLFLALTFSTALIVAYWIWIPVLGAGAPLASAFFAGGWLAIESASEIKPNVAASLLGIAAVGLLARRLRGEDGGVVIWAAVSVALMALFRPSEAAALTAAAWLYVLLLRRSDWRILVPLTLGLAAGWLPWLIEMSVRFGGPLDALRLSSAAAQAGKASIWQNASLYLANTNGQLTGIPVLGVVWWGWIIIAWIIAVIGAKTRPERAAVGLCSFAALAFLLEYFAWIGVHQDRYLLPAYGLVAVLAAAGIMSLLRGPTLAKRIGAFSLVLVVPWAVWQGSVVRGVEDQAREREAILVPVGARVAELAAGRPCTLVSTNSAPYLAYAAGCVVPVIPARLQQLAQGSAPFAQGAIHHGGPSTSELKALSEGHGLVFVVAAGRVSPPLASLSPKAKFTEGKQLWRIYELGAHEPAT